MPTAFTHAAVGVTFSQVLPRDIRKGRVLLALAGAAVVPDLDVVAFSLGIPYSHPFGHRGFSHSLLFAVLVSVLAATLLLRSPDLRRRRWWLVSIAFFAATASHGLLDAATDAGLGIGFYVPFINERYFLPYRPLETSSVDPVHFILNWRRALNILLSELLWIWLPLLALSAALQLGRRLAGILSRSTASSGES